MSFYGASLLLKEQTTIRMYYQLTEGNITNHKFAVDGKELQPIQSGDSNIYYVELNNIAAQDLEKVHTFTAGNITISNYSALSYVNKALNSEKSSENNKKKDSGSPLFILECSRIIFFLKKFNFKKKYVNDKCTFVHELKIKSLKERTKQMKEAYESPDFEIIELEGEVATARLVKRQQ